MTARLASRRLRDAWLVLRGRKVAVPTPSTPSTHPPGHTYYFTTTGIQVDNITRWHDNHLSPPTTS